MNAILLRVGLNTHLNAYIVSHETQKMVLYAIRKRYLMNQNNECYYAYLVQHCFYLIYKIFVTIIQTHLFISCLDCTFLYFSVFIVTSYKLVSIKVFPMRPSFMDLKGGKQNFHITAQFIFSLTFRI